MAKIALAIGATVASVAGIMLFPFASPGFIALEAASVGMALGGALAFRPPVPGMMPLQDRQVTSSADGAPICFGYGRGRFAGQVIWSPGIKFFTVGQRSSSKGGGSAAGQQYVYQASFAVAFGEGPATIEQIWADSKLIYQGGQDFGSFWPWDPTIPYLPDQLVSFRFNPGTGDVTAIFQCVIANQGISPAGSSLHWTLTSYAFWNDLGASIQYYAGNQVAYPGRSDYAAGSGAIYTCVNPNLNQTPRPASDWNTMSQYYGTPTFYPGSRTQTPDPTIQGNEGVDKTPAFRGLCYAVFENFPLANFGNRVPNLRAEVNFAPPGATPQLSDIVLDLCERGGLDSSLVDVSALELMVPDPTLPLTGSTFLATFVVQAARNNAWYSVTVTLGSIPKVGNTLLAFGGCGQGPSGIGLPAGFSLLAGYAAGTTFGASVAIGSRVVQPGDGTAWTFTKQNTSDSGAHNDFYIIELQGRVVINATAGAAGSVPSSGSAAVTAAPLVAGNGLSIVGFFAYFVGNFSGMTPSGFAMPSWAGTDLVTFVGNLAATPVNATYNSTAIGGYTETVGFANIQIFPGVSAVFPTSDVPGYILERQVTAAAAIKELMVGHFFGACESDGRVKFAPRTFLTPAGTTPETVFTIPEDDLGLLSDKFKLQEEFAQEQDLPLMVTALYNSIALNWQQGKQLKQRDARTAATRQQQILSMPLSLSDQNARKIAEATLYAAWQNRTSYSFNLWRALYALLDPTDIVNVVYEGQNYEMRIVRNTVGQGLAVALKCVNEDVRNYGSLQAGVVNTSFTPAAPVSSAPTILWVFDLPLLRDSDSNASGSGFYVALSSIAAGWPGAALYQSSDDAEFAQMDSDGVPASFGYVLTALGAPASPWTWDNVNTLQIQLTVGALAGASDLAVLNGANVLIVGGEVIQFANAVQNMDGSWTVSRLLRGRRGTETACAGHAISDVVIQPLAGGVLREPAPLAQIGQLRYFRGVTLGQAVSSAQDVNLTLAGNDLKPYAPAAVGGSVDGSGNITIAWFRRTRLGGDWLDSIGNVPLAEDLEAYDVEIMSGATVKRTFAGLSSPTVVYSAAEQATDFGAPQAVVSVNVYQISQKVGRGFKAAGIAPAATPALA